jgi:decaprenyl-phosphate phosphoribosyltransferase
VQSMRTPTLPVRPGRLDPVASPSVGADAAAPGALTTPRRARPRAVVALLRPRQWVKNGLVIAAPAAAGALGHDDVLVRLALACVAFCLLASGLYAINDVRDAAEDRLHPRKRRRPVAAGEIDPAQATSLGIGLMLAGLAICWFTRPALVLVGLAYLALTISYTLVWRSVLVLDLLAISGGFVLRAAAGGVAAPVALSRWFVLVISAAAVFVAAAKRYSELRRTRETLAPGRRVVGRYSPRLLELIMGTSVITAIVAYSAWAFELPVAGGFPWRPVTILPFSLCLIRYATRVRAGAAEAPEELLLSDRLLGVAAVAWLALFALSVHAAG